MTEYALLTLSLTVLLLALWSIVAGLLFRWHRRRMDAIEVRLDAIYPLVVAELPSDKRPSFTCADCGRPSWNPNDVRYGYCGNCHAYTEAR